MAFVALKLLKSINGLGGGRGGGGGDDQYLGDDYEDYIKEISGGWRWWHPMALEALKLPKSINYPGDPEVAYTQGGLAK